MKKATLLVGLCLLFVLLTACGQAKVTDLDLEAIAAELRDTCGEDLYLLETDALPLTYGELDWELAVAYASSGTSAEEIALFQATDEEGAKTLMAALEARMSERLESYADYLPDEAEKLRQGICIQQGSYVALCVSPDAKASQDILDQYFK